MAMPLEVLASVKGFLQLSPGLEASDANLETMLADVQRAGYYEIYNGTDTDARPRIAFSVVTCARKPNYLVMNVFMPTLRATRWDQHSVHGCSHPVTPEGLLACILEGRAALKAMLRGLCETCAAREPPRKRLKATGMPVCVDCAFCASFGL